MKGCGTLPCRSIMPACDSSAKRRARGPRGGSPGNALLELGEQHGYRNAQATVIAPTGTIGLVMDCDTTGIEPDFALVKFKKLGRRRLFQDHQPRGSGGAARRSVTARPRSTR